jgi:hypothetical protein
MEKNPNARGEPPSEDVWPADAARASANHNGHRVCERAPGVSPSQVPKCLPAVFSRAEVQLVLAYVHGHPELMASLLYGAGLCLMVRVRLCIREPPYPSASLRDARAGSELRYPHRAGAVRGLRWAPNHHLLACVEAGKERGAESSGDDLARLASTIHEHR